MVVEVHQVVGRFQLIRGKEDQWDAAFRERVEEARDFDGWRGAAAWIPAGDDSQRVVVGRWVQRQDYENWTLSSSYSRTKELLDACQAGPPEIEWFAPAFVADVVD
jgi:heme-degrading monooxygenase HmoA